MTDQERLRQLEDRLCKAADQDAPTTAASADQLLELARLLLAK